MAETEKKIVLLEQLKTFKTAYDADLKTKHFDPIDATLATKVDKVTGKSLIDDTEIDRLKGIETGAQVNKIEVVKANGTALPIDPADKSVNVVVPTKVTDLTDNANYVLKTDTIAEAAHAATADKLTTPVNIAGVAFDGSQAIDLTADNVGAVAKTAVGAANGVAPLNGSSLIDAKYLPSYVDDVVMYADKAALDAALATLEEGKIYVTNDTGSVYRYAAPAEGQQATTANIIQINNKVGTADEAVTAKTAEKVANALTINDTAYDGSATVAFKLLDTQKTDAQTVASTITAPGFIGDLTGTADQVKNALTINGKEYNGSAAQSFTLLDTTTATAQTVVSTITAPEFIGKLTGNADSASKVNNALTINGTAFDGSAAKEFSLLDTQKSGNQTVASTITAPEFIGNLTGTASEATHAAAADAATTATSADTAKKTTGTLTIGTQTFNGSADVSIAVASDADIQALFA